MNINIVISKINERYELLHVMCEDGGYFEVREKNSYKKGYTYKSTKEKIKCLIDIKNNFNSKDGM